MQDVKCGCGIRSDVEWFDTILDMVCCAMTIEMMVEMQHIASFHIKLIFQAPHSTSHHHQFSPYCTFHITSAPVAAHYSTLQYHISNRTISATLCITLISHRYIPHSMYSTPHFRPHHILWCGLECMLWDSAIYI